MPSPAVATLASLVSGRDPFRFLPRSGVTHCNIGRLRFTPTQCADWGRNSARLGETPWPGHRQVRAGVPQRYCTRKKRWPKVAVARVSVARTDPRDLRLSLDGQQRTKSHSTRAWWQALPLHSVPLWGSIQRYMVEPHGSSAHADLPPVPLHYAR